MKMNQPDPQKIKKMKEYLQIINQPDSATNRSEKLTAISELFNYYHGDWQRDALYFAANNVTLFDDNQMQTIIANHNPDRKLPRTIIKTEEQSKYKRHMKPGQD